MPSIEEALSQFRQQQGTSEIERLLLEFRNKEIETEPSKTEAVFGKVKDVVREVGEKEYAPPRERPERKPHERSAKVEGGRVRTESQEAFAEGMSRGLGVKFTPHEGEVHPSTGVEKIAGSVAGSLLGFTPWIAGGSMVAQPFTAGAGLSTTKAGQIANQMARGASSLGLAEGARQTMTGEQSPEQIAVSATIGAVADPLFSQAVEWLTKRFGTNWRFGPKGEEMPIKDAYAELGLKSNATREQVKSAWRRLSKFNHPDYIRNHPEAGGSVDKFKKVVTAYERIASTWSKGKATPVATEPTPPTASTQTLVPLQEGAMVGATPPVGVPSVTPIVPEASVGEPVPLTEASEELISPLTSVVNTPSVGEVLEKVRGKAKGAVDLAKKTFSVTQPFNDLGAPETGRALERVFTTQEFNVTKAEDVLQKPLTKVKRNSNLSDNDLTESYLLAYNNKEFSALPVAEQQRLAPAIDLMKSYIKEMDTIHKQEGVYEEGFAENPEPRVRDEIQAIKEEMVQAKSEEKLHRLAEKLQEAEKQLDWWVEHRGEITYMPIPARYWFGEIYKKRGAVFASKLMSQHFHERQTYDLRALMDDLLEKGLITRKQVDPRRIFADYSRTAGTKLAMADVYNSAKKEGLIVARNKKGAPTNWPSFPESVAPNLRNHVVHPTLYEYINKNLMSQGQINPEEQEIIRGFRHWWTMMKLNQFVDPFRLGLNNLYQGVHFGSMRSPQTPLYLKKAVTACATHNEDYMTALKHGLMPRPYRLPLNETMARVERIIESETFTKMAMGELKRMVPTAIPEIYRLVHYFAWGVCDHIPRMATYYYLLDKGFSPEEAAREGSIIHGNYPGIPPATRQKANILFNTPSFGMSMIKVMAQMGMSIPRRIAGDKSDKNTLYLKAFISILAFKLGMQIVMENLGFRTETAGRRYTRDARLPVKMRGAQGTQPREVVYVHADPYNMLERYWDNLKRMGRAGSWVDKVTLAMPFAPHVGIMYIKEWLENRQPSGAKIYSKNDPPLQQAIDATKYLGNRIIRLSEYVSVEPEEKMRREIKETVAEDIGKIAHVLDYIGFFYDRPSKEEQFAGKVRDIEGDIKKDLKYDLKASDEKQRQRVERAKERILEAKVEYDTYGNQDSFIKKVRKTIAELLATLGK